MSTPSAPARLRIAEVFLSLQGEGPSLGVPAHFLRLQGCSVGCSWCDSKYTWDASGGEAASLNDVLARLRALGDARLLVVTGGEPLEHPGIEALLAWAAGHWPRVEVETSGLGPVPTVAPNVEWRWSPKLSRVSPKADLTWEAARAMQASGRFVCKVVVQDEQDWDEACARVNRAGIPAAHVVVMPEGMTREALRERMAWLAPRCVRAGFRLTPRLHVDIWGARRGV